MLTQECLQDAVKYGECFIKFGKTAEYIPELARVNKYHLGACIVGLDGTVMEYGDTRTPFTIQTCFADPCHQRPRRGLPVP